MKTHSFFKQVFVFCSLVLLLTGFQACSSGGGGGGGVIIGSAFSLTIQEPAVSDGTLVIEPVKASYALNEKVLLTATAAAGKYFKNWTGDASGSTNPMTVNMDKNKTIGANFVSTFTLAVDVNTTDGGTIEVSPVKARFYDGEPVVLTATAATDYTFNRWSGDYTGTDNPASVAVTKNMVITALFAPVAPKHQLTVSISPSNAGTCGIVSGQYAEGTELPVTATASRGYSFKKFSAGAWSSTANPASYIMPTSAETLTAEFDAMAVITITSAVSSNGAGTCVITPPANPSYKGDEIGLSAVAARGYRFTGFSDGQGWTASSTPATYTLGDGDVTITANYEALDPAAVSVTVSPVASGTVVTNPASGPYYPGETVGFTATAAVGYVFTGWSGASTSSNTTVNLILGASTSLTANFREPRLSVTQAGGSGAAIGMSPAGTAVSAGVAGFVPGTTVSLTAPKVAGYTFFRWSAGGMLKSYNASYDVTVNSDTTITAEYVRNTWTVMVYLDGDNDLEANAIQDLNEMESVDLRGSGITVITLLDRGSTAKAGFDDTSNGNWTGTRLIPVVYDANGVDGTIISNSIASSGLGLTVNGNEELNMADPANIVKFIADSKVYAQADNYTVIFWDHGSGWRRATTLPVLKSPAMQSPELTRSPGSSVPVPPKVAVPQMDGFRSLCLDEASGDILYTKEIGTALTGQDIDVIGFDLCLAGMLEVAYEVKDCAAYMIASPEVTPADGWEYDQWLTNFKAKTTKTGLELVKSVVDTYKTKYSSVGGACMAGYDLTKVDALMSSFFTVTNSVSSYITGGATATTRLSRRNTVITALYGYTEDYFSAPGDLNLDIGSMASALYNKAPLSCTTTNLNNLIAAVNGVVVSKWYNTNTIPANGNTNSFGTGIAVHFNCLDNTAALDPGSEDIAYFRDHATAFGTAPSSVPSFVDDMFVLSWCPNATLGSGLIWYLLYETSLYQ